MGNNLKYGKHKLTKAERTDTLQVLRRRAMVATRRAARWRGRVLAAKRAMVIAEAEAVAAEEALRQYVAEILDKRKVA